MRIATALLIAAGLSLPADAHADEFTPGLDDGDVDETESSAALLLAAGYALADTDIGVLDLQLRMGTVFYEELDTSLYNGSLSLGLTWY